MVLDDPLGIVTSWDLRKDTSVIASRVHSEGLSFLTKTLPRLGKALDEGLITSRFSVPRGFVKSHECSSRPAFLQAYFKRIFGDDGSLLENACPFAVSHVRQVCFAMYKLEVPFDAVDETRVIEMFIDTDANLPSSFDEATIPLLDGASYLVRDIFSGFDPKDIIPRHGPGAVATGERLDEKWDFSRLFNSIHQQYPYYDFFVAGGGTELIDRLDWYKALERRESGVAKVVLVPKDSRGPRLISAEPLEYQYVQQGLGRAIVNHLEAHHWTSGQINFVSQDVNRELALSSSLTNHYSTLDLKDASDRVSLSLVKHLFAHSEELLKCLLATRTTATTLPDGRVMPLNKFAPMGSALCFPVEAVCFWSIIVAAISRATGIRPPLVGKDVFVYGDDIVVPRPWAHLSIQALESVGLLVNRPKSCIEGFFRESCGMDAFRGIQVTPTRVKKIFTGSSVDGAAYAAYVSVANALQHRGYESTATFLWELISGTYGPVPYGTPTSSFPCKEEVTASVAEMKNLLDRRRSRSNGPLQRLEFRVLKLSNKSYTVTLDGWQRLLRDLVMPPFVDPSTMVVPRSIQTKRGWAAIT